MKRTDDTITFSEATMRRFAVPKEVNPARALALARTVLIQAGTAHEPFVDSDYPQKGQLATVTVGRAKELQQFAVDLTVLCMSEIITQLLTDPDLPD